MTRAYVKTAGKAGQPANFKRMKSGPKGAGRPIATFPVKFKTAAFEMWRDGASIEDIRAFLLSMGHNIAIKAIQDTLAPPALKPEEPTKDGSPRAEKNLASPFFDWDMRGIVDDLIQDGREPSHILAWFHNQGLNPTLEEVIEYVLVRQEQLAKLDPLQIEKQRLELHLRSTRSKLVEVWKNMPEDKRYSEKTFMALLGEHRYGQQMLIDDLRKANQGSGAQVEQANQEIESKLGLLDDEPAQAADTLN